MLDEQAIRDRRTVYTFCLADIAKKKRAAQVLGRDVADLNRREWILLWARHVLQSFALTGEDCGSQWCPTEDDVKCAMRLADPGCVKCSCEQTIVNPIPPPPPCNIVANRSVRAAYDAVNFVQGLSLPILVISDQFDSQNLWSQNVGNIMQGNIPILVPEGNVIYAQVGGTYWIMTAGGIGAYFPLLNAVVVNGTTITISSEWPMVNAYLVNRTIKVEVLEVAGWRTVYEGLDNQGITQTYAAVNPTSIKVTYMLGTCTWGAYIGYVIGPGDHNFEDHNDDHY